MLPEQIQAVVDDLVRFHCQTIKPDKIYIVMLAGGAARFNWLQMNVSKPCNVIQTKAGLVPVRDHYIYPVAEGPKPRAGEVTVATADLLHTKMCAVGKKGADVTLGDIHVAARAEVLARLSDAGLSVDDTKTDSPDLVTGALGEAVDQGTVDPAAKEPLPATAVQIVVGDTVMSEPFRTPEEAERSEQYAALKLIPEVANGTNMIWLRPVQET
jgi:hypothetical protein